MHFAIAFVCLALAPASTLALPLDSNHFRLGSGNQNSNVPTRAVMITARAERPPINNNGGNKGNNKNDGGKGNTGGNNKNGGKGNTGGNAKTTKATTTAKPVQTGKNGNGNNNNGNNGNGNNNGNNGGDPQKSRVLDPRVIGSNFANDGQDQPAEGQVPSLTSTNNFINFCLTVPNLPITNGQQIQSGSCNPVPIGSIPSTNKMPSSKFVFPSNFGTLKANEPFTIKMAVKNLVTGNFVNAKKSYFAAPQQLDRTGTIVGHSHVVIERINSLKDTTPTNPQVFEFFKGLNGAAQGGVLTADLANGLRAGTYRLASINTAANHQPAIVPIAQHGSLDDMIYFEVTETGKSNSGATQANPAATAPAATATGKGNTGQGRNLQKFTNALLGEKAPAISQNGQRFTVEGAQGDFSSLASAVQRSCDVQKNKCADKVNGSRNSGIKVSDCDKQVQQCRAAN